MRKDYNFKDRTRLKIAISKIATEDIDIKEKNSFINGKLALAACAFIVLTSGIVFAKDIENYMKKIFNNSTEAIDVAVENGYIQEENSAYIYDKDIGIKVDNLVLDNLNLDISFNFETKKEKVKYIRLKDFIIANDNEKVVYDSEIKKVENIEDLPLYNYVSSINEPIKLTDTTFTDSILLGLREHEKFNKLFFQITKIDVIYEDDTKETIEGSWNFDSTISNQMKNSPKKIYAFAENNDYIESCVGELLPSGMIIELKPKNQIDIQKFQEYWNNVNINNIDELYIEINGNKYMHSGWNLNVQNSSIILHYDNIGIFSEEVDTIRLVSEVYNTVIVLEK